MLMRVMFAAYLITDEFRASISPRVLRVCQMTFIVGSENISDFQSINCAQVRTHACTADCGAQGCYCGHASKRNRRSVAILHANASSADDRCVSGLMKLGFENPLSARYGTRLH
jgi:hypothetical protein